MANINGQYYIFGHRHTNRSMFSRQGYADPIVMDEKGHFKQASRTSSGFDSKPATGFRACKACHLYSKRGATFSFELSQSKRHPYITQEEGAEGPYQYITGMRDGATAAFRYVDLSQGSQMSITLRGEARGKFILLDMDSQTEIGQVDVDSSTQWKNYVLPYTWDNDKVWLGFKFKGKGKMDFLEFNVE